MILKQSWSNLELTLLWRSITAQFILKLQMTKIKIFDFIKKFKIYSAVTYKNSLTWFP